MKKEQNNSNNTNKSKHMNHADLYECNAETDYKRFCYCELHNRAYGVQQQHLRK